MSRPGDGQSLETEFTKEQAAAIAHRKGHLRIIACPGSGKTEVVSQRIVRLIEAGADPATIVAFTFTEKAADELKFRIRQILERRLPGKSDFGDMFVGTIHAFCFHMLREIDPAYRSYDVLDDPKRVAFVSKGRNYYGRIGLVRLEKANGLRHYQTINTFLASADIVMTEDINPAKLSDERFRECYINYRKLLDEERYFDFSSVMHTFVDAIRRSPESRKLLTERVRHVVCDEYQDVNRIQEKLIELLSKGAESVCVVGDDDQNIYHWRGSDVGIIRTFRTRYGRKYHVTDVHLSTNFRSTGEIIGAARNFIEHNRERLTKDMGPNPGLARKFEKGDLIYSHFENDADEEEFVAGKIRDLHKTDFLDKRNRPFSLSYGDFAVLVRTNADAARMVASLEHEGIPCIAYSGESVFEREEAVLAMNCIAYLFRAKSYPDFGKTPTLPQLTQKYREVFAPLSKEAKPDKFVFEMARLKKEVDGLFAKGKKDYLGVLGLQGYYYRILRAMGAERFDFGDVIHYNLAAVSRAISDYESVWVRLRATEVPYFSGFVYAFARGHYAETQHSDPSLIDAVNILTIHKAKGLEFPVVFMPGFEKRGWGRDEGTFVDEGLYDAGKYSGTEEDERRVYYTAMTRAEKYLFITGSKRHEGRKISYSPHPFATEVDMRDFTGPLTLKKPRSGYPPKPRADGIYPTSYSELTAYDRCPQEFKLRHVVQYNAGVPPTFGYGTNIHNALNIIHSNFIRKGTVPDDTEVETIVDRIFKLRYATKTMSDNMKKKALAVVQNYVRLHKGDFTRILQTEKRFEFAMDDALIQGQIDLLKKVDEKGNLTEVEIIDFKTDRNDSIYTPDYQKQLKFYAIACLESLGLNPKKAIVHHLDGNTKDPVDVSDPVLEGTRQEVKKTVASILKKSFPATPSNRLCSQCDYRAICPYKRVS
jgi:ATP-dependent DNA helicase UvrD/PcrA